MSIDTKVDTIATDVKRIIKLLMGDLDTPEKDGLVTKVSKNTDFRLVYLNTIRAVKTRFWLVLLAVVVVFIVSTFGKGLINILGGN